MRKTIAGLLAAAASLGVVGSASAAIRTATLTLAAPMQPPSLVPEPPIVDDTPYPDTMSVSYDDAAGSVTGAGSFFDPAYWSSNPAPGLDGDLPVFGFDLYTNCGTNPRQPTPSGLDLTLGVDPGTPFSSDNPSTTSGASLTGYAGSLDGTGSFDGTNYIGTVQSPAFIGRDFRCVQYDIGDPLYGGSLSLRQGYEYLSEFPITEWLDGYAPLPKAPTGGNGKPIRPGFIGTSPTGGNFLAGWTGRKSAKRGFGRLRWSRWTQTDANATGALWQDDCRPACVNGTYHATRAKIHLYRVKRRRRVQPHDGTRWTR